MADLGTAYVKIAPNMTGIQGKISRGFRGSAGPATKALGAEVNRNKGGFQSAIRGLGKIAKVGGIAIASGLAVGIAGLAALTAKAVMSGAELEQQLGGSEVVFGEFAEAIQAKSKTAFKEAGLSQAEFLQGANKMGSLFKGSGLTMEQSMEATTAAIQRASDVASIMGITTQEALDAVTGAAKGNFTMMDNLGVTMNITSLEAAALESGLGKTYAQMNQGEKMLLAQEVFMKGSADAAGNYAKENKTLSGSLNTTKKAFDNVMSGEGDVGDFVESLVNTLEIAVPKIVEIVPKLVTGISATLNALVPALANALPVLVPALINAVVGLINALVDALPTVVGVLLKALPVLIDAFIELFMAILLALPEIVKIVAEAIPTIVDALVDGLTSPESLNALIMGTVELLLAIIEAIPIILPALASATPLIVRNIIKTLTSREFLSNMKDAGVRLIMAVISGLGSLMSDVWKVASDIFKQISKVLSVDNLIAVGKNLVEGLWEGISSMAQWVKDKISGFAQDVLDGIKSFFGISSPSKVFAGIGVNLNEGLAKGLGSSAGMVLNEVDKMSNEVLANMAQPTVNASAAFSGAPGLSSGLAGGSVNNQTVNIDNIELGDENAVKEFFNQLNQDTMSVGMGITPNQGITA